MSDPAEWARKTTAIAQYAVEQWLSLRKVVIIEVVPNKANIFCCLLADEVHRLRPMDAQIHLEYPNGPLVVAAAKNDWLLLSEQELLDRF